MARIPGLASAVPLESDSTEVSANRLRACVVTSEILGPIKNGGIATATSGLVDQLVADGAEVKVLYTLVERETPAVAQRDWGHWVRDAKRHGVTLDHIPHAGTYRDWRRKSWLVKEYLEARTFDVVYFNEHHGSGYYAMAASRANIAPFSKQLHCVITHGSIEWVFRTNDQYVKEASDIEMIGMERRSVEWADVVIAPSRFLLNQYESYGWKLPATCLHQPYALVRKPLPDYDDSKAAVDELVFFGRLEARKGLWTFCEALNGLKDELRGKTVTFLGRATDMAGVTSAHPIIVQAARWPFRVRLLTDYDQEDALEYLSQGNRLAIMPSLSDNSPCVIYECLEKGVPFVAASGSGADELVDDRDAPNVFAEPTAVSLREKLRTVLKEGASKARPSFDPIGNLATWSAWHRHLASDSVKVKHGGLETSTRLPEGTVPLLVTVDAGNQPLEILLSNVEQHLRQFGRRARHLVWTVRRDPVRDLILRILHKRLGDIDVDVGVLTPEDIDDMHSQLDASEVVLVCDAAFSIELPFFARATSMLMSGRASVVSCITATLDRIAGKYWLVDLPCGDLPGVVALGEPAGSGVWGFRTEDMEAALPALALYDTLSDAVPSSASLGQQMIESCLFAGKPFLLLPMIGAYDRPDTRALPPPRPSREDVKRTARKLRLRSSIHGGGAPWVAMSMFGRHRRQNPKHLAHSRLLVPPEHPARSQEFEGNENGMASLSAAFGKLGQAMQITAAADDSRITQLLAIASDSRSNCHRIDLLAALRTMLEGAGDASQDITTLQSPRPAQMDGKRVGIIDGELFVTGISGQDALDPIVFTDVHLAGHKAIEIVCSEPGLSSRRKAGPDHLRVMILDQETGREIGSHLIELAGPGLAKATIPLRQVYSIVTITIAAQCAAKSGAIMVHDMIVA